MNIDILWYIMHREIRIYVYREDGSERRFFLGNTATIGF